MIESACRALQQIKPLFGWLAEWAWSWTSVAWCIALFSTVWGVMLGINAFSLAQFFFAASVVIFLARVLTWKELRERPRAERSIVFTIAFLIIGLISFFEIRWVRNKWIAAIAKPDVVLSLVSLEHPDFILENVSDKVAEQVKWWIVLIDLDSRNLRDTIKIPASTFDFLRPHERSIPEDVFSAPRTSSDLKIGDELFGFGAVTCPDCKDTRYIWISINWGKGGWFAPLAPEAPYIDLQAFGKAVPEIVKNRDLINRKIPTKNRVPILPN